MEVLICKKKDWENMVICVSARWFEIALSVQLQFELHRLQLCQVWNRPMVQSNNIGHISDRVQWVHEGLP